MILEINHINEIVSDIDKSIKFYTENLEAKVVKEGFIQATNSRVVCLQIAGSLLELISPEDKTNIKTGFNHIAFLVDNIENSYIKMTSLGYEFSVLPRMAGTGEGKIAFFSDPTGIRLEFVERADSYKIPQIITGKIKSLDHVSIVAINSDKTEEFYRDVLSLDMLRRFHIEATGQRFTYLNKGIDVIELAIAKSQNTPINPIDHISFRVESVDEMVDILKSKNISFDAGSPRNSGTGYGRVAFFRDPDGARIELVDRKDLREL